MRAEALSRACERDVVFFEETDSTNLRARELGRQGAPSGTLVVADGQTGGKGRLGRSWQSPPGLNLYFSLLLRPPISPEAAPLQCLATALAVADATQAVIKWPNDVVDREDHKLAGILAELETAGSRLAFVVLGVGLNVNQQRFPPELPDAVGLGHGIDRVALLARVVSRIEDRCAQAVHDPEAMLHAWRARSRTLGRRVRLGSVEGFAEDIGSDGALLVRTEDGLRAVLSGDVELIGR